jgi:hypothetical protein
MIKLFSEKTVALAAFATALGGSMIAFPLVLDNPAFALDAKDAGPAHGPWSHHMPLPGEMVEARLAYAKTALKITDAQSKQWNAVADVIRKQAKDRDAKIAAMRAKFEADKGHEAEPGPGHEFDMIEGMERRQKMMTERAAALGELIAAAKPLYATLSDEQKQMANHLLMRGMDGDHGHRGGWGGHGPGGHGPGPDGQGPGPGAPPPR